MTSEESCHSFSPEPEQVPETSQKLLPATRRAEEVQTGWEVSKRRAPGTESRGVGCKGSVDNSVEVKTYCEKHPRDLLEGLRGLADSESLCDVTLKVDGQNFRAHRVVLAAASEFLKVLLVGGWKESKEEVVQLQEMTGDAFRSILRFLYSGELAAKGIDELLDILVASEHLGIQSVRDLCVERLQQLLDLPNALQVWVFAQQVGCAELEAVASEVLCSQFSQVAATSKDFLELDAQQLRELLSSDQLAVDSEDEVYSALLQWVKHAPADRSAALPDLLPHIRFRLLPTWTLSSLHEEPILKPYLESEPVAQLVARAKAVQEATQPTADPAELVVAAVQARPRQPRVGKYLLALGGRPAWTLVEKLEVKTMRWSEAAPMAQARMRHGSATVNGRVYVVGGKDQAGHALASMERYDALRDSWETLAPMPTARTGLAVGAVAGRLYAVGGRDESGLRLRTVECYNVQSGAWCTRANMSMARGAVKVAALHGHLYVVGGRSDQGEAVASVERYDPIADHWQPVAPMNTPRVGAGVEVLNGLLYAIGGKDDRGNKLRSVERFDSRTNAWSQVASMVTKRWGAGVASLDSRLFVLGGMNGAERGSLPTVEAYDPATDAWTELPDGPSLARGSCTFAAV